MSIYDNLIIMQLIFIFINDLFFYKHTLKTTKDSVKFFSTEARIDISVSKLRYERDCLQDKLGINVLHATHLD